MKKIMKSGWVTTLVPLLIVGCGGSEDNAHYKLGTLSSPNDKGVPGLNKVRTYQNHSYSDEVLNCSRLFLSNDSCSVTSIKPIGAEVTDDVTIDDIKKRLVVSHSWMANSFIAALKVINDQDLLNLFKALNTIVISYEVRPSFYHPATASMYIDPRFLWRNTSEWETIYQQDDYRREYQSEFITDSAQRYVDPSSKEDVVWSNFYSESQGYTKRTSAKIAPGLYGLLVHELAHANDFLTADVIASITDQGKIFHHYIEPADGNYINNDLHAAYPLTSELLHEAATISYNGQQMTDRARTMDGYTAGNEFDKDGAAKFYAYSNTPEDVATLFETYMMYKKYGAVSDVAFLRVPTTETYTCNDWKVEWGQRNRLADQNVKDRAILVASRLLGKEVTADLTSLSSAPIDMETDIGWCDSQIMTGSSESIIFEEFRTHSASNSDSVYRHYLEDFIQE